MKPKGLPPPEHALRELREARETLPFSDTKDVEAVRETPV